MFEGLGGFVSSLFGSKNTAGANAKAYADAPKVDPNAYQYGGTPGGADTAVNHYQGVANQAQYRNGAQANYAQSIQDRGQALDARNGQATLASRMQARAMGQVPSIAGQQAAIDMQRAQAAQQAQAASARGPAGMALAQQQAANNTANAQGQISGQAQVNAANERMQAEQGASNAYGALRGGDQQQQGQDAQQSQFQAQMQQQQHGLNDQMQLGMVQAEQGVRNAQLTAGMNQQSQQSGNALGAAGINAGVGGQNASMNQANGMALTGMVQKGAGGVADGFARGGFARAGAPAIVGEQGPEYVDPQDRRGFMVGQNGPELIVPRQNSVVVPNDQLPPDVAPRTHGIGRGVTQYQVDEDNRKAEERQGYQEEAARRAPMTGAMAVPGFSPGIKASAVQPLVQRDQDTVSRIGARQAEGIDPSDADAQQLQSAQYRLGQTRKADAQAAKPSLASVMKSSGDDTMAAARGIDTSYHGSAQHYTPPTLLQISGRAMGGPMAGGSPYVVGEQGPEFVSAVPSSIAQGNMTGPPPDALDRSVQQFYKGYGAKAPSHQPGTAFLEGGGPAPAGKPAVVGEQGPEYVVEEPKEPRWRDTPLARALASGKSQEGPAALPLDEGNGKYLQQSADGHAYLATAPSEDDGRPSLASRMKGSSPAPAPAASRPAPPPPKAAPRKMTDDELMAAANAMGAQQQAEHEARMAAGPAVRMPVELSKAQDGTPVAVAQPEHAISFSATRPPEEADPMSTLAMPESPTALPPPRHPPIAMTNAADDGSTQWPGTSYRVIPKEMAYSVGTRPKAGLARAMRKR